MKQIGIYGLCNVITNKWYVGQSRDIVARWQGHMSALRKGVHVNHKLQMAYGWDNRDRFEQVVLSKLLIPLSKVELVQWLDSTEKLWIQALDALKSGYNQTAGGSGMSGCPDPLEQNLYSWGNRPPKKHLIGKAYWKALRRPVGIRRVAMGLLP